MLKDFYYILGIKNNASKDEIKKAYRKLSLKFHPDHNDGDKFFEERFKDINEAYETLIDDSKRVTYDLNLANRVRTAAQPRTQTQNSSNTESQRNTNFDSTKENKQTNSTGEKKTGNNKKSTSSTNRKDDPTRKAESQINFIFQIIGLISFLVFMIIFAGNNAPKESQATPHTYPSSNSALEPTVIGQIKNSNDAQETKNPVLVDSTPKTDYSSSLSHSDRKRNNSHKDYSKYFTIGSHRDEVAKIQGTPTAINNYSFSEIWSYDLSSITFRNGEVISYNNFDHNLKVSLKKLLPENQGDYENVQSVESFPKTKFFRIGSTWSDVIRVQGTPSAVNSYSFSEIWSFGLSSVTFQRGRVTSYNNFEHNLRIEY